MSFGRQFTTIAQWAIWLSSFLFVSTSCATPSNDNGLYPQAVQYLQSAISTKLIQLGDLAKRCNKKSNIDVTNVKDKLPNISLEKLSVALMHLERNNYYQCVKDTELELNALLMQFSNLVASAKNKGIDVNQNTADEVMSARNLLASTSAEAVLLRTQYHLLSKDIRSKLESIPDFKTKSFNVFKVIEDLRKQNFGEQI